MDIQAIQNPLTTDPNSLLICGEKVKDLKLMDHIEVLINGRLLVVEIRALQLYRGCVLGTVVDEKL